MRNLTESELEGIAQRAELFFVYHDTGALRAEDVADLLTEVRELHRLRQHLIALNRQHLDHLSVDAAEADPP
jgi:hypothetical protein